MSVCKVSGRSGLIDRTQIASVEPTSTSIRDGGAGVPEESQSGLAPEGYLLSGPRASECLEAVALIACHLRADVISWSPRDQCFEGQPIGHGGAKVLLADFRGNFNLEDIAVFECAVQDLMQSGLTAPVAKVMLLNSVAFQVLGNAAVGMGYAEKNQYILGDINHLIRLDPDFWIHGRVRQVARQEAIYLCAISEAMSFLLETHRWRYGWLEFDLFARATLLKIGNSAILTRTHLPHWFEDLVEPRLGAIYQGIARHNGILDVRSRKKNTVDLKKVIAGSG